MLSQKSLPPHGAPAVRAQTIAKAKEALDTKHIRASSVELTQGSQPSCFPVSSISMFTRKAVAIVAGTVLGVPFLALSILPYARRPTPKPNRPPPPLPAGVKRVFTPQGLELYIARPTSPNANQNKAPIFLQHGGFGTASVWNEWIAYFASKDRTVYALSLSGQFFTSLDSEGDIPVSPDALVLGHGESPRPKDFNWWGLKQFGAELKASLDYVQTLDPTAPPPVVVGHSAGGGLSQWTIQNTDARISGLICIGAIPPSGMLRVYKNWFTTDLCVTPRLLWHGGDMKSPLSSPQLVRRAFFSPQLPEGRLKEFFEYNLNHEESVTWPLQMMGRYVQPLIVRSKIPKGRVFWVAGEHDVLVDPVLTKGAAAEYGVDMAVVTGAG